MILQTSILVDMGAMEGGSTKGMHHNVLSVVTMDIAGTLARREIQKILQKCLLREGLLRRRKRRQQHQCPQRTSLYLLAICLDQCSSLTCLQQPLHQHLGSGKKRKHTSSKTSSTPSIPSASFGAASNQMLVVPEEMQLVDGDKKKNKRKRGKKPTATTQPTTTQPTGSPAMSTRSKVQGGCSSPAMGTRSKRKLCVADVGWWLFGCCKPYLVTC